MRVGELESLLFALLFWACGGRLTWLLAIDYRLAAAEMFCAMTIDFQVHSKLHYVPWPDTCACCTWPRQWMVPALPLLFTV